MTWQTVRLESESNLTIVLNPSNPVATIRNLTNLGSKEIIGTMIDKVNMMVSGGELI